MALLAKLWLTLAITTLITADSIPRGEQSFNVWNVSLTFVDYSTTQRTMELDFRLGYLDVPSPEKDILCKVSRKHGPLNQWKFCSTDMVHAKVTNLKVAETVEFDLHVVRYNWTQSVN